MCRWLAYLGDPVNVGSVLYEPKNSIIHQSKESQLGYEPTNGDGFGVGWYIDGVEQPVKYRSTQPAWNDANLKEITRNLESPCFIAHVRATTGTAVQQSNCHPFRYGNWLFAHNGLVRGWKKVRRELVFAVDPSLYPHIQGSTDSEVLFHLALTLGLENDPLAAIEKMVSMVESACSKVGVDNAIQMTICATQGSALYAARYATEGVARSLFVTSDAKTVKDMYPENAKLGIFPDNAHMIVSEPLSDLKGAHHEVPQNQAIIVTREGVESHDFLPAGVKA
jgi:predicted glutamine amidotransferase